MTAKLFGILNITEDSFSDGGRFLAPAAALSQAHHLLRNGADFIDLGAAASNPAAQAVSPPDEIARLKPLIESLPKDLLSIDSFSTPVQRWALQQGVGWLNDIQGFADPALYPDLAQSTCRLIVMHAVQSRGKADHQSFPADKIVDHCLHFFEDRLHRLSEAGIAQDRLVLDPGMGFFLGADPDASYAMLRAIPRLKQAFACPVLISVSRKSFLRHSTGRDAQDTGPATLGAELYALHQGADFIRTHDPAPLKDAQIIWNKLVS